ncbi:MAG: GNAT family N-acetyltransferase [Bacteroidia bacterium]|jgi:predicted GNAT family acetyltransferase
MEIIHQVLKKNGRFYSENDQTMVAELTYVKSGYNKIIIDSSFVHPSLDKEEILIQLIKKLFDFAVVNKLQIINFCNDVKQLADENEKYASLIYSI